ncbi:HK97 family phage prohead protease [Mesorhizobium sp. LHD-90]|uniref:HK97 family phage prohead protease n=1 Tax=Mesorhizobium sp. LHD-90 TaxID=3071414 RepID=UPI0027DFDA0B|nr:HK97 family phage prohead protease [Mesorhizobium sp. LHD-90]MDQ6433761.1 HK97 family phage prohead protease [Mesorhizobium sp. LHD-90]
MNPYVLPITKTIIQSQYVRSITARLIAHYNNDTALAAQAEHDMAACKNMMAELDAIGARRKFSAGQVVTLKAPQGSDGIVTGWASTSDLDLYGHKIMRGAFSQSISSRGLTGPRAIKLLLDHDWHKPAGLIRQLEYRADNLWIDAQLALDVEYVRDRYTVIKMLNGFNFSVGFILEDYEIKTDPVTKNEYLQVNRGDLFEVSVVAFPGNEAATTVEVRSLSDNEKLERMIDQIRGLKRELGK